jgi:hypothetical protein
MNEDLVLFHRVSENFLASDIGTTWRTVDHSVILPVSRIREIEYGTSYIGSVGFICYASDDAGSSVSFFIGNTPPTAGDLQPDAWGRQTEQKMSLKPFKATRYFIANNASVDLHCHAVRIKR